MSSQSVKLLTFRAGLPASVAQLDAPSDWRPSGCEFNPRRGRQHAFMEIVREIFSTVILSLPLIQEGQLSVSGERMCTILVNRLEDKACPVNVWLGKLTALDMTPLGWLGCKTSTQTNPGQVQSSKLLTSTCAHTSTSNWQLPLNQMKWKNDHTNDFMINLLESYAAELGFELATPGSAVKGATDCTMKSHWDTNINMHRQTYWTGWMPR